MHWPHLEWMFCSRGRKPLCFSFLTDYWASLLSKWNLFFYPSYITTRHQKAFNNCSITQCIKNNYKDDVERKWLNFVCEYNIYMKYILVGSSHLEDLWWYRLEGIFLVTKIILFLVLCIHWVFHITHHFLRLEKFGNI